MPNPTICVPPEVLICPPNDEACYCIRPSPKPLPTYCAPPGMVICDAGGRNCECVQAVPSSPEKPVCRVGIVYPGNDPGQADIETMNCQAPGDAAFALAAVLAALLRTR